MTWYERSKDAIFEVMYFNPGLEPEELRKKVSDAYPFGPRANHPYKIWLKAVDDILGPSEKKIAIHKAKKEELDQKLGQEKMDV